MKSVLSIDIANGKSEVLLITEYGEILLEPYEIKHCLNDFNLLKNKIDKFKLDDLTVFYGINFYLSFTYSKIFY